jgi:hypothetical protein
MEPSVVVLGDDVELKPHGGLGLLELNWPTVLRFMSCPDPFWS